MITEQDAVEDLYDGPERRQSWPADLDASFWKRLYMYMTNEDRKFAEGAARMAAIEKDLQPIKKMYWAIVGSTGVGALLLCLMTYVYLQDKAENKEMQKTVVIYGEAIKELMVSRKEFEQTYHRDIDRLERGQDRILENQTNGKARR